MPTIEELEHDIWPEPEFESHLVTTCHRLRKKPIDTFTTEDLRIMIGKKMALKFLVPGAIALLEKDPRAEGDFDPGDLLKSMTSVRSSFFEQSLEHYLRAVAIAKRALTMLKSCSAVELADYGRMEIPQQQYLSCSRCLSATLTMKMDAACSGQYSMVWKQLRGMNLNYYNLSKLGQLNLAS